MKKLLVYGCEPDEASMFQKKSREYGVQTQLINTPLSMDNVKMAAGAKFISVGHKTRIKASVLKELNHSGVTCISTRSIGCNHIDVDTAEELGIKVKNTPYSPGSVAEYTVMMILMAARNAQSVVNRAKAGDYRLDLHRGREIGRQTIGVIGTGQIGRAVIERLRGFGCKILAYDTYRQADIEYVSLEQLLKQSDIITLHIPLCVDTFHFINGERIKMMKKDAIIVNTGRGGLIDTKELVKALEERQITGAALDVIEGEEDFFYKDCHERFKKHEYLARLQAIPNVIITPHTAFYTEESLEDTVENTLKNCLAYEGRLNHEEA